MGSFGQIIGQDIDAHVSKIANELSEYGIHREELTQLDHLCYRVETLERYEEMKRTLDTIATLCGESDVQGRPIAIYELHEYIVAGGWVIPYIELPAPKEGSYYPEGLEHAEFVVNGSLEQFVGRHGDIVFDAKSAGRDINPEYGLKNDRAAMKFHKLQIGAVVDIERTISPSAQISTSKQ